VLDRIADKWAVLVLGLLADSGALQPAPAPDRGYFAEDAVADAEKPGTDGLVLRKVTPTVPVTVEYSITPLGLTLSATVDGLRIWAETHIEKVLLAQQQYDAVAVKPGHVTLDAVQNLDFSLSVRCKSPHLLGKTFFSTRRPVPETGGQRPTARCALGRKRCLGYPSS